MKLEGISMFLAEIFTQLTYGEFAELSIGGKDDGGINPEDFPNIISHVNLALTELHKRFNLKTNEILLVQQEGVTTYPLKPQFAMMNAESSEPIRYIDDTARFPFEDDLLKIERILDEEGEEVPLNKLNNGNSFFTPKFNTLQIPVTHVNVNNTLSIIYRANHELLEATESIDPQVTEVELPPALLEALLFYVASRVHSNVPAIEGDTGEGMRFMAKFEASCQRVEALGLIAEEEVTNSKLEDRGFV